MGVWARETNNCQIFSKHAVRDFPVSSHMQRQCLSLSKATIWNNAATLAMLWNAISYRSMHINNKAKTNCVCCIFVLPNSLITCARGWPLNVNVKTKSIKRNASQSRKKKTNHSFCKAVPVNRNNNADNSLSFNFWKLVSIKLILEDWVSFRENFKGVMQLMNCSYRKDSIH